MTPVLEARSVSLAGRLKRTDLQIGPGVLAALIGPNGSGKTSLLRRLVGIDEGNGNVKIAGNDVTSLPTTRRPYLLTFLPASRDMAWPISVRDVIALGLPRADDQRIDKLIEQLELQNLERRPANRLSTGERARVLLARALAPKPKLLLLDEPLSNLDPYWVLRLLEILREAIADGTSALVALHDIDRITAFDRALLMAGGSICADLPPAEMLESEALADAFRIKREVVGWRLSRPEDPQSSP